MIVAVDQPRSVNTYYSLAEHLSEECSIVTPSYKGISGHPVLFHKSLLRELLTIQETTKGLKKIVECHPTKRLMIDIDDPLIPLNINTIADYEEALNTLTKERQ